jgi:hypothetical protein
VGGISKLYKQPSIIIIIIIIIIISCWYCGEFFASLLHSDRFWGPPSLLYSRHPAVKRPGREGDHSPLSSAEVRNVFSCTPISSLWRGAELSTETNLPCTKEWNFLNIESHDVVPKLREGAEFKTFSPSTRIDFTEKCDYVTELPSWLVRLWVDLLFRNAVKFMHEPEDLRGNVEPYVPLSNKW